MNRNSNPRNYALATQFRQQAAKIKPVTALVKLPIPSIADGFVFEFVARRIDIASMLMAGTLPESMARMILEIRTPDAVAKIEEEAQIEAEQMGAKEQLDLLQFQKKIALQVCVEPQLVFRDVVDPGEIDLRGIEFADKLIAALYGYAMGLSPAVPVVTTDGGETTVAAVETFPPKPEFSDAGADGAAVRQAAQ